MAGAEPSSSGTFIIGGTTIGGANSKKPSDALSLDYCTFRVPYEDLNIRYRQGQKKLDLAAHLTSKAANLLTKKVHGSNEPISQDALRKNFDILLKQVQDAKEAFANSMDACIEYSDKISFRCDKLEEEFTDDERAANMEIDAERAEKSRFGRYIAWHLLRCGMIESAKRLIEELGLDGMMDVEIFERIYEVEQAIHARNTKPCIEWCEFNRSRLKRIGSRMEIVARQQDVVTFIEEGNVIDAVNYVKSYVTPITKKSLLEI
uniref:E3 ubiquitin-protein transferase MAEA n=1 Tax=Caenorhabditis tropicalis TaxID=1561998 RepID=A0A1I7TBS2_9PELO